MSWVPDFGSRVPPTVPGLRYHFSDIPLIMECLELNWLYKHIKKVRSSQAAIFVLNWVKQSFSLCVALRSNKKQLNENTIYSLISSKSESLSKDQLEERLNFLVIEEKLKNKPNNGKNSYYVETNRSILFSSIETPIQHGPPAIPTLTETTENTLPTDKTPLRPESLSSPMLNNLQRFTNENTLLKE